MPRSMNAQNTIKYRPSQEERILKFYVDERKGEEQEDEKQFNCLRKNGFFCILSKCAETSSFDKFKDDIKRVAKEQKYRKGSKEQKAVKKLEKHWLIELGVIRKCVDCYAYWTMAEKNEDYFTLLCSEPHLLVLVPEAIEEGPRMWVAKLLSVNDNRTVTVECFGDHLRGDFKFNECFLYAESPARKMNVLYANDKKFEKQEDYKQSFSEVEKYIDNIMRKFGAFVPAVSKITISDVNQHLIDMYPGAFAQNPLSANIIEPQAEQVNNEDAEPSSRHTGNNLPAKRNSREVSQGYMSQGTSVYGSDYFDDDSDSGDLFDLNPSDGLLTPIETSRIDMKIVHVEENYSQHNAPNNETDNGDSEQLLEKKTIEAENCPKPNRKRKAYNQQPFHSPKKILRGFETGHSSGNDDFIVIEDKHQDDTERMSTSARNKDEQANNVGHIDAQILKEFGQNAVEINKCKEKLMELQAKKLAIEAKLKKN